MLPDSFRKIVDASRASGVALFATLALTTLPMPAHAIEEPEYRVVRAFPDFEVRQYPAYSVAEVVLPGSADAVASQAFPILAGYIFGKNKGDKTFEMTAPVTQQPAPTKLPMTAPVTVTAASDGYCMQFVLPKGVTAATAPEPLDTRVRLRDVPASEVAVISYSGFWSESNDHAHLATLEAALRAVDLAWDGPAVYARYNPPFTPWFMRRNELWLHLAGH